MYVREEDEGEGWMRLYLQTAVKNKSFPCSLYFTFYELVLSACSSKDLVLWKANRTV